MVRNNNNIDTIADKIATELEAELGDNHIATLLYGQPVVSGAGGGGGTAAISTTVPEMKIPIFVVVKHFDKTTALKLNEIALKWKSKGVHGPFVAELSDLEGMADSIPDELLDIAVGYRVLRGKDILKTLPEFDFEHLRAQAELAIRRYIFTLRWTLAQMIHSDDELKSYLNNLAFYCLLSIRCYSRITRPRVVRQTTQELVAKFYQDFPEAKNLLQQLFGYVYENKKLSYEPLDLIIEVFNHVLKPILTRLDALGKARIEQF